MSTTNRGETTELSDDRTAQNRGEGESVYVCVPAPIADIAGIDGGDTVTVSVDYSERSPTVKIDKRD